MSQGIKWFTGGIVFAVILGGSIYFGYQYGKNKADNSINKNGTQSEVSSAATSTPAPSVSITDSQYNGWKTYTNSAIGYKLKYPSDWVVKEINEMREATGYEVKYITITTPDGKYFLDFGLKKKNDAFEISDKVGIGNGTIAKTGNKILILNTSVDIESLKDNNKIKEYFYPQDGTNTTDGKMKFIAGFSYTAKANYQTLNMSNLEEADSVMMILKSVELL